MELNEKIRMIRKAEGLGQEDFAAGVGLPYGTFKNIEQGVSSPKYEHIGQILKNPKYRCYAIWLMLDETIVDVGQVSPSSKGAGNSEFDNLESALNSDLAIDKFQDFLKDLNKLTADYME